MESKIDLQIIKAEDPMVSEIRTIIESKKSNSESIENDEIITVQICPICNDVVYGKRKNCQVCGFLLS
ncbi:MAG: hypothetical protein ACFE94_08930 [Candidatus Hodarchaeota archaeon]